jgi:membrane-associated protease RseP (regulator of RpoE activity)
MGFLEFITSNKWVLLFYGTIILLLILFRKKFDKQGIVYLYRTKIGLKLMDKISSKYSELVKLFGYIGIGIAYIGLFLISFYLIQNLYQLLFVPKAQAGVSLVIPGVKIPGAAITIPLISGWIALFIIVLVHEFSHGVIAKAHGLKIKSSGIVFFGPILGAFVEPDEKDVGKRNEAIQYSIFAAGPFSNIVLAGIALVIGIFLLVPAINAISEPNGFSIIQIQKDFPAEKAGLKPGIVTAEINGIKINDSTKFQEEMKKVKIGDTIIFNQNDTKISVVAGSHPDGFAQGYAGVIVGKTEYSLKQENIFTNIIYKILMWLVQLFELIFILSMGIGLINLLPLGPVDGGRMIHLTLIKSMKDRKKAIRWWTNISLFFLMILALNILYPLFSGIIQKIFGLG